VVEDSRGVFQGAKEVILSEPRSGFWDSEKVLAVIRKEAIDKLNSSVVVQPLSDDLGNIL